MKVPQSIPNPICHLKKSIYGIKHTSRVWFHKLSFTLSILGFSHYQADHSLVTKKTQSSTTIILVYVNDLLIIGNLLPTIPHTKDQLKNHFNIIDLGTLRFFLGLEITQTPNGIHSGQSMYKFDLLEFHFLLDAKPTPTPIHAYSSCPDYLAK